MKDKDEMNEEGGREIGASPGVDPSGEELSNNSPVQTSSPESEETAKVQANAILLLTSGAANGGQDGKPGISPDSVPLPKSAEEWAPILIMALRAKKMTILGLGRIFHAAKSSLARGGWTGIWKLKKSERPPVSKRKGDRYALIGQEFGNANETTLSHLVNKLPGSAGALYCLAMLGRQLVIELIVDGKIHEGLTAAKARQLLYEHRPDLKQERPFTRDRWLARFHTLMGVLATEGTHEDLIAVLPDVRVAVETMAAQTSEPVQKETPESGETNNPA